MQDQPSDVELGWADDEADREVLVLLLESDLPGPWSVPELVLQVGSKLAAAGAVMHLHAAGLVHVRHEFAWPTRTAAQTTDLAGSQRQVDSSRIVMSTAHPPLADTIAVE